MATTIGSTQSYGSAIPSFSSFGTQPMSYNSATVAKMENQKKQTTKTSMSLNDAKKHLENIITEEMPVMLWGPPGIGKSSIVKQIATEKQIELIDLRLTLLNPIDLRGLPFLDQQKKQAIWLPPEFLPTNGAGILFLDEINIAPVSTQQAAYELLLDRRIGNYILPKNWRIVAAGNRESDRASVNTMPTPLMNRMIHLSVDADIDDWKIWAQGKIDERIIAFLNFRPTHLAVVPKKEEKAFPTPRSWEFVSRILKLYPTLDDAYPVIEGAVGQGVAKEFIAYASMWKELPDINAILMGQENMVPKKNDVLYALVAALVNRVDQSTLDNFIKYIMHLPPEFSILAMRDAAKGGLKNQIVENKTYQNKWATKFGKYL